MKKQTVPPLPPPPPPLTVEQREAALSAQIREMNITSNDAVQIGRETLQSLDGQDKELKQTNHQLEATGYIINQSKRTLENMTYSGWLYNKLFASELKDPHASSSSSLKNIHGNVSVADTKRADAAIAMRVAMTSSSSSSSSHDRSQCDQQNNVFMTNTHDDNNVNTIHQSSQLRKNLNEDEENLRDVLAATNELHEMSLAMSSHLDEQKSALSTIDKNASEANEKALLLTIHTAKMTQRTRGSRSKYVGTYQFVHTSSKLCLGHVNGELQLQTMQQHGNKPRHTSLFDVHVREGLIFGIRSHSNLKFIGTTIMGGIKVSGHGFRSYEEVHVALNGGSKAETGIFVINVNWGAGGWMTMKENVTATRAEWNRLREEYERRGDSKPPRYEDIKKVWEFGISENMDDKENMLLLKPVLVGS